MPTSRKKAILRTWDPGTGNHATEAQGWLAGYLPMSGFLHAGRIELLDLAGKVRAVEVEVVKWVCFVRDFNSGELANPERLLRKTFLGRPRINGLWVRVTLKDEDVLEGIAANDKSLVASGGLSLIPPDTRSNAQSLFLPAASIVRMEVLAVIGAAAKPKPAGRTEAEKVRQSELFNP